MFQSCPLLGYDNTYRSIDGTCNNPFNLGASNRQLSRVISAHYEDGKYSTHVYKVSAKLAEVYRVRSAHYEDGKYSTYMCT